MLRDPLKQLLQDYADRFPEETAVPCFIRFVNTYSNCFERSLEVGHVTASAWIIDPTANKVLLVHHKKLNLWLQPGGHCDGDPDVIRVVRKEVYEETGLRSYKLMDKQIFDLDIHTIPHWNGIPEHKHFDVRFLIHADKEEAIQVSEESNDLQWFDFSEVKKTAADQSIIRLVDKSTGLKNPNLS